MSNDKIVDDSPIRDDGVCREVFALVLVNVALNWRSTVRNWPELTILHHLLGTLLWLVLPLFAVFLMRRGKAISRWILVGLFGLRTVGEMLILIGYRQFLTQSPGMCLHEPFRTYIVEMIFYGGGVIWLLSSKRVQQSLSRSENTGQVLDGANREGFDADRDHSDRGID